MHVRLLQYQQICQIQYQRQFIDNKQSNSMNRTNSKSKQNCEVLQNFFSLMSVLVKQQNSLQTYKQIITERADFNPQTLFNYLAKGNTFISRKHIISALQQNQVVCTEEQIKIIFTSYGYKQGLDFSGFLNYLYPVSIQCLKLISQERIKKYSKLQTKISQQVMCLFILLMQEQLQYFKNYQIAKIELFSKINRKIIKKLVRSIKKEGQCKYQFQIQTQNVITYEQFKMTLKNLQKEKLIKSKGRNTLAGLQKNLPCIFRRLSMGKNSIVTLQQLQFWLRPSTSFKIQDSQIEVCQKNKIADQEVSCFA